MELGHLSIADLPNQLASVRRTRICRCGLGRIKRELAEMIKGVVKSVVGDVCYERLRYARIGRQLRRSSPYRKSRNKPPNLNRAIGEYWRPYGVRVNPTWHELYCNVQKTDTPEQFIPEDIFYAHIEPELNRSDLSTAYEDKNSYNAVFRVRTPYCHLRNINGVFYDHEYSRLSAEEVDTRVRDMRGSFIIKPSLESGKGRLVQMYTFDRGNVARDGDKVGWNEVAQTYGQDYVVQNVVRQHGTLAEFNCDSVNTLRLMTMRTGPDCELISARLRIGRRHSCVDQLSAGGYSCGIRPEDGKINEFATDSRFRLHKVHADSGKAFGSEYVPGWDAALGLVSELHRQLRYFDLVSWDVAIDEDTLPVLIELNLRFQDISFHQVCNGPLFGTHTKSVLNRVFLRQ